MFTYKDISIFVGSHKEHMEQSKSKVKLTLDGNVFTFEGLLDEDLRDWLCLFEDTFHKFWKLTERKNYTFEIHKPESIETIKIKAIYGDVYFKYIEKSLHGLDYKLIPPHPLDLKGQMKLDYEPNELQNQLNMLMLQLH